jgi:hypothetical protein
MVLNAKTSAADFRQMRAQAPHASSVAIGDEAFFDPSSSSVQLRKGTSSVIVQVVVKTKAGTQYAQAIRTGLMSIGRSVAAQL